VCDFRALNGGSKRISFFRSSVSQSGFPPWRGKSRITFAESAASFWRLKRRCPDLPKQASSAGGYQWVLKAPEAELKSLTGEILGKHFGGPAWSLNDGSELLGSLPPLKAISAADRQNIPWLLIAAKSRNGLGILGSAEYVLRIATVGGIPPAEPPKSATDMARVKYRAIYLFLRQATP
jgi:hypothetical protein